MSLALRPELPSVPKTGTQVLSFQGLQFNATLGLLSHEKVTPQAISVDVMLNLGKQPLLPKDDDIVNVLDYRVVRQLIIEECTSKHVHLLETLIGKVAEGLLRVPGVLGVKLQIAKLEIFEDCRVALAIEAGEW